MPVNIPVHATQLEESILRQVRSAGRKIGSKGGINLGTSAKSIEALSQPLGRITGKADQFTKSMEAANARVLAFGASVGVLNAVTKSFKDLVATTIEVEKQLTAINAILGSSSSELDRFKKTIFSVARDTEQSFATVAEAALEFSRQGLSAQKVVERLNDSMILARLSGLGASEAVAGLTAAINSFNSTGIKSSEVLNKLSAAAAAAAVSERDLIEGIKRSGAVAIQAGVEFNELVGVISAVQEKTARGGAVIGNSFKTIFTRLQSLEKLKTMRDLGVEVTDASGAVLSATKLISNLGKTLKNLPSAERLQIAENLVGKFQVAPFLAILEDMSQETSRFAQITQVAGDATNEAYTRNIALNKTLAAAINEAGVNLKELANTLGEIGVTDSLKNILGFFNNLVTGIKNVLEGEGLGSDFARGIVKGIGNVISGPGLAIFGAIIAKLTLDLVKFGVGSLKTFFGLNSAAKQIAQTQGQIAATLLNNKSVQDQILAIEKSQLTTEQKKLAQTEFFTQALNKQLATLQKMQAIAARVAPGVVRGTGGRSAAGGYIPNFAAGYGSEQAAINKGVGGAPPSARPVTIPNFAFGGGQRGTMVANTSEYIVPNFAGGGSAIFNQDMVKSMGLPSGARRVSAAKGYIPNFATAQQTLWSTFLRDRGLTAASFGGSSRKPLSSFLTGGGNEVARQARADFNNLSETQIRNLKVRDRQRAVLGTQYKGRKKTKYGVLFPDAKGGQPVTTFALDKNTPMLGIPVATDPPNVLYKEVRDALIQAAGNYAKRLGFRPDIVNESKFQNAVSKNLNPGSIEGAYGTVFEAAFQGAIGNVAPSNELWDLKSPVEISALLEKMSGMGMTQKSGEPKWRAAIKGLMAADFKNTLSIGNIASLKNKVAKSAAGGYIPNFAEGALMDAISREQSAGLPLNQIRINQSSRLKNAANPKGLAVTNMRDEPTGAIPNYAKPNNMNMASGDLMMKFMGLTMAAQMLSGIFSQVGDETSNFSKGMGEATQALMMMSMMAMMGGGGFGFKPLAAGRWSQKGGEMIGSGMAVFGGPKTKSGKPDMRFKANQAGRMAKVGGGLKAVGGVGLKGLSMFGRLIPVIGQVIFAFQGINAIFKMFGADLGKGLSDTFNQIGMAMGLVDTPAVKAAKALDKLTDASYQAAAAQDGFTPDTAKKFFENMKNVLGEQEARKQLSPEELEEIKGDKSAMAARAKLFERTTEKGAAVSVADFFKKNAEFAVPIGEKITTVTDTAAIITGREKISAKFGAGASEKEIRQAILEAGTMEAPDRDTRVDLRGAYGFLGMGSGIDKFTEGGVKMIRPSQKALDKLVKKVLEDIADSNAELEKAIDEADFKAIDKIKSEGLLRNAPDPDIVERLGSARGAALGAFVSPEENKRMRDMVLGGASEDDIISAQEKALANLTGPQGEAYRNLVKSIQEGTKDYAENEKEFNRLIAEGNKEREQSVQTEKIQESLAKARLKNAIELATLQASISTEADLENKTRLALLDTTAKEKAELELQIAARERQKGLVADQIKLTSKLVQEQGTFAAKLKSRNPTEDINLEDFKKVKGLIEETNQKILEQGGFTEAIGTRLKERLIDEGLSKTLAENVVDLIAEQNNGLKQQVDLKGQIATKESLRKKVEESRLNTQNRIISNLQAELSFQGELNNLALEKEKIELKIAELQGQKIGQGKEGSLAIERKITEERKKQAQLDLDAERARITQGLRQDLFSAAKSAGLNLNQLSDIQGQLKGANLFEGGSVAFTDIINQIETASKEAEKARIKAAADELLKANTKAQIEIQAAIDAGSIIRQSAVDFANTIGNFMGFENVVVEAAKKGTLGEEALDNLKKERKGIKRQRNRGFDAVDRRPADTALFDKFLEALAAGDLAAAKFATQVQGLKNGMEEAGRIFTTFADLVRNFFENVEDEAAQIQFDRYRQTSATGLIGNIRDDFFNQEKRNIKRNFSDPYKRMEQIALLDERRALGDLDMQAALSPTAAGANQALREKDILQDIFVVKKQLLDGTLSEKEAMEELVRLEKKRLEVNNSLKAMFQDEFIKKDSEIAKQFNEKFVGAARAFSTELSHGVVDAIAKGEKLKDVLLGAATNFLNTMAKAFMDRAVDNLVQGLSSFTGSIGNSAAAKGAEGGVVRGGSGSRDDVPALLMGGEYVMRKGAVKKYGLGFFEALNSGNMRGFSNGGFIMPGLRGAGAISGKRDLLRFAGQSSTAGKTDRIFSGANFASIDLEPESMRLTNYGRATNVMGQRTRQAKEEALGLYFQQLDQERSRKEQRDQLAQARRDQKKAFWRSLGMAALSAGVAYGAGRFKDAMAGRKAAGGGFGASNFGQSFKKFQFEKPAWHGFSARNAAGGYVGDAAGVDTIPSMLSGGEFVMNAGTTQRIGASNLQALNAGGGMGSADERVIQKLDNIAESGRGETTINITVNSNGSEEGTPQGGGDTGARDQDNNLAIKLKDAVREVLSQEQRLGGMLNR